jgi:hypothetical protein
MTPKRLRQLSQDPNLIPGIYNYCDAWCERCPYTAHCLTYKMQREMMAESGLAAEPPPEVDNDKAKFWKDLSENLKRAGDVFGDDLDEATSDGPVDDDEPVARHRRARAKRRRDPLIKDAEAYMMAAIDWFKDHADDPAPKAADELRDAVEVIQWYHMFITVKLTRAVGDGDDEEMDPEDADDEDAQAFKKHDADGSAKIALLAVERSLGAWSRLRDAYPTETTRIREILTRLARLRVRLERRFPDARAFNVFPADV